MVIVIYHPRARAAAIYVQLSQSVERLELFLCSFRWLCTLTQVAIGQVMIYRGVPKALRRKVWRITLGGVLGSEPAPPSASREWPKSVTWHAPSPAVLRCATVLASHRSRRNVFPITMPRLCWEEILSRGLIVEFLLLYQRIFVGLAIRPNTTCGVPF